MPWQDLCLIIFLSKTSLLTSGLLQYMQSTMIICAWKKIRHKAFIMVTSSSICTSPHLEPSDFKATHIKSLGKYQEINIDIYIITIVTSEQIQWWSRSKGTKPTANLWTICDGVLSNSEWIIVVLKFNVGKRQNFHLQHFYLFNIN